MEAKPHTPENYEGSAALRVWCLLAGLALASTPIGHSYPIGFLYCLLESPVAGWTRFARYEAYWFTSIGLPFAARSRVAASDSEADRTGL